MESILVFVSDSLGLSLPVSRFLLAYVAAIPTSLVFRILPRGSKAATDWRHAVAALSGIILTVAAFGTQSLPLVFFPILTAYSIILVLPKHCGLATFVVNFCFLIRCHVSMMSGDAWREGSIDCTGALMILVLKTISVAMDRQDGFGAHKQWQHGVPEETSPALGQAEPKREARARTGAGAEAGARAGAQARSSAGADSPSVHALDDTPGPLEFLGYCFCCALHLAGPFYFFSDYKHWIECEQEYSWLQNPQQPQPPFALRISQALAQAFLSALVYLWFNSILDVSVLFDSQVYYALPFWRRAWLLYLAGTTTRFKFYFIWSISEACMVGCGLGFSGWRQRKTVSGKETPKEASWERAENCHILAMELASSAALFAANWNVSVGRWLRAYVYERLAPEGRSKKPFLQLLATQLVAGIWHGLYPGYILFFSGIAWEVAGSRVIYKWQKLIPEHMRSARFVARAAHTLYAAFCNNFVAIGFIVLTAQATLRAWSGLYFLGLLLPALALASEPIYQKQKFKLENKSSEVT